MTLLSLFQKKKKHSLSVNKKLNNFLKKSED